MNRKTKIVCTLGPAVDSKEKIDSLVAAGMNVARINCSHGDWPTRENWIRWLRELSAERDTPIAILLDLQGPKFRLGVLPGTGLEVRSGQKLRVGTELPIAHPEVLAVLQPGKQILTGDGDVSFRVVSRKDNEIDVVCVTGGQVRSRQGVTVVGVSFNVPALTEKDVEDLTHGLAIGVDYLAISYVKSAEDVRQVSDRAAKVDSAVQVIAKIEMRDAVANIDEIIDVSGGIMVARGDMGLQMPIEDVPLVQKRIISLCRIAGKPVITATQMMESMIQNPRPTRAETTDIANAILDGTDAIMLSGETAYGKYPVEAVAYMDRIASKTEKSPEFAKAISAFRSDRIHEATEAVAQAAVYIAQSMKAKAILCFSTSGFSARMISKFKPKMPILCATYREKTAMQTALLWGVQPILTARFGATEEMISMGFEAALEKGALKVGDLVVITAGVPIGRPGNTNLVTLLPVQRPEKVK